MTLSKLQLAALALLLASGAARAEGPVRPGLRGVNIDPANPWAYPSAEAVARLGLSRVRFVYKADHASVAAAVERYEGAGIRVTLVLNNETVDMLGVSWPPRGRAQWLLYRAQYLRAAAEAGLRLRRFGAAVSYQLWNEENLEGSHVPPEEYGPLAREAAAVLRLVHPGSEIVLGSLLHNADAVPYLEASIQADSGLLDAVDSLGVHTYGELQGFPRELEEAYHGFGKPLSLTEWGECGLAPDEAARAMRGYLRSLHETPIVREAYYFGWSESQSPGCGFGLTDPADEPGPDGELYALRPAMAWAFRSALTTWEEAEPEVRLLFTAGYGPELARTRWEAEHARDADEPGWRGADFENIADLRAWADEYRRSGGASPATE